MMNKFAAMVARHAGIERPVTIRIISLLFGLVLFIIAIPLLLGLLGHFVAQFIPLTIPRNVEIALGMTTATIGLIILTWCIVVFWRVGKGTPVPFVSPTRLITSGPFRYTRNPMKLGVTTLYFGMGTGFDQFTTGLVMFLVGMAFGIAYHKLIEEKELLARYGEEYAAYRDCTPFVWPRWRR
ncbi:MAG: isoprenylcysteine carboxylmethyltransferase family protein [Candidatus Coatesbacteria bacterium]|nr:isoprenylcysteine carboxylmethyltransferase family protein [Candidatus Coatesbacteria bacterium]